VWLIVAVVAALALATVELGISLFLQLFLKSLGLLSTDVKTPLVHFDLTPGMLAAGLTVIAMIRSLSQFLVGQSATVAMETINARIRRLAIWDMLLHPSQRVVPAAAVNARVGDLAVKSSLFCFAGAALIGSLVQAIALAVAMSFTAIGETAIALAGLVLIGLLVLRVNKTTRKVTSNVPAELRVLTEGIERVARNMSLVRVLRTQALEQRRLATAVDRYASYLVHAGYLGNFAMAVTPFAGVLLILLIVGWSQSVLHTPGIILLSFLYLFVRFVQALATATSQFSNCSATWPMFKDSLEYVSSFGRDDMNSAMRVGDALIGRAIERVRSRGGEPPEIAVRGVAFAYPGTDVEVLRDVSAEISKGAQFAIVGPSGAGKSTLLGIILGLFEPSRGSVRIDGRSPAAYFNDSRVRVGYVGAEAFLIAGSIRENLRYGISREADDDDLFDALAQARLREAVEGLQGRLDYVIGEDGSGLSAGQKQRLCLARALLNRPHVLVLDEASANLDAETESEIAESLRNLHGTCTMIVVSHRKGLLKYADRTVTLGQSE
jgi:ABC-type multidrug transport system fused ATPase/permease subunit